MSSSAMDSPDHGSGHKADDASANLAGAAHAAQDAAGVKRPGSSLIIIPPVTRQTETPQAAPAQDPLGETPRASGAFAAAAADKLRALKGEWLRYAAPVALGFVLFGVGLATGGQFFGASSKASAPPMAPTKVASTDQTETRHLIKMLSDEMHALQTRVDGLRVAQSATPEDVRALKKSLDGLRASLDATKIETSASIAQLSAKVDHFQHDEARMLPGDKANHADHAFPVPATTASISHPSAPHMGEMQAALATPAALPKDPAAALPPTAADAKKKPQQLLVNWVVRDVYRGVALVDGPDGAIEVGRGDPIPGAGTVESIERRNGGWVIVTSRGIVGSVVRE